MVLTPEQIDRIESILDFDGEINVMPVKMEGGRLMARDPQSRSYGQVVSDPERDDITEFLWIFPPHAKMSLQWHRQNERALVVAGSANWFSGTGSKTETKVGDMVKYQPFESHRLEIGPEGATLLVTFTPAIHEVIHV